MAGSIEPCKAPDHLLGVWKRAFITAPAQGPPTFRDETTQASSPVCLSYTLIQG